MDGFRRVTPDDADGIAAVQAVLASDPPTWALLEGTPLRDDEARHLVLEVPPGVTLDKKFLWVDASCLIEVVAGYPDPGTWYLGLVFVAPAARNSGRGTRVLHALFDHVRARGGTAVRLAVVVENTAARRLYDRLGFQLVARRPRGAQLCDVLELAL